MSWHFPEKALRKNVRNRLELLDAPRAAPPKAARQRLDIQLVSVACAIKRERVFVERKTLEIRTGVVDKNCIII